MAHEKGPCIERGEQCDVHDDESSAILGRSVGAGSIRPESGRSADRHPGTGATVVIEHLQADGTYAPAESSRFLPVSAADTRRWLVDEDSSRSLPWERRLIDWARGLARRAQSDHDDSPPSEDPV
jgi:hypothetical protein